jgi:hypothetical protein
MRCREPEHAGARKRLVGLDLACRGKHDRQRLRPRVAGDQRERPHRTARELVDTLLARARDAAQPVLRVADKLGRRVHQARRLEIEALGERAHAPLERRRRAEPDEVGHRGLLAEVERHRRNPGSDREWPRRLGDAREPLALVFYPPVPCVDHAQRVGFSDHRPWPP